VVYFHIGLLDKGWAEIQKALEIKPSNNRARFRLGVINIYQANYEQALRVFKSIPREVNPALLIATWLQLYSSLGEWTRHQHSLKNT